jgi:hypothetical protein
MTASFTSKLRTAGLVLAIALTTSAISTSQSFAFSAEAKQACIGDAFKLCSSDIPNIPAVTACMFKHKADLSPGCRAVMDKEMSGKPKVASN